MDNFTKLYIQRCEPELAEFHFKRKRTTFVRVVNDVMQNFVLEKLHGGRAYRVLFAVIPLCLPIEKTYISGGVYSYALRRFEIVRGTMAFDRWECNPKSNECIQACIESIMQFIRVHLMPFFECANCCRTALPELINLERRFNENRKASLQLAGIRDAAKTDGVNLFDPVKYYMALKNGDYNFALKSRQVLERQNVYAYQDSMARGFLSPKSKLDRERAIQTLRKEIKYLQAGDTSYFHQLLLQNEAYSKENLREIF